ncbi:MAG: hypothetical protein Unbinned6316contig1000_44 [Prokaryotic dsDNA virus sp.]|nr:MAG: hypothetical protein Unbinned6316contig1000_44 [Prokaryotic dsDNA virus sp.]|tara:strand:- start:11412 stop:12329 length:918 start_codon:yes stop_codon:yes gene_type:complete
MAIDATASNYAGKAAGFYISAALRQANSMDFLTMIENIKYKSNIQKMANTGMVRNASCNFTEHGTLTLTEAVLTPKNLQVNTDICKSSLLESWEALQMRAGAGAPPPASFDDYVISYVGEIIANATEVSLWTGNDATPGEFTGFVGGGVGHLVTDGTVVDVANVGGAGTAFTATNIIQNLQNTSAAILSTVYTKDDLYLYMSPKSYRLYISAISTLGYVNAYSMNGDYDAVFEGLKIAVCNGMKDDVIVAAEKSNMFFGTDLLSDQTRIQLLDMSGLDGSDNMRLVARYSGGTQVGIGADTVLTS